MKKTTVIALAISTLALGGCATNGPDFSQMTPAQIQAYQAYRAQQSQQLAAILADTDQWSAQMQSQANQTYRRIQSQTPPAVGPYGQPRSGYVYCKSLGTYVVHCRD